MNITQTPKKRTRILFISQTPLHSSSTNRYVALCRTLIAEGFAVTLFFIGKGKSPEDSAIVYPREIDGIDIRTTMPIPPFLLGNQGIFSALAASIYLLATCFPLLAVHCLRTDIVTLAKPLPFGGFLALLCTAITRKPLVLDCDDWEGVGGFATIKQGGNAFAKAVITYFEERIPVASRAVVVVSAILKKRMELCGIPDDRILYLPPGADISRFSPAVSGDVVRSRFGLNDALVICYLGLFKPGGANWQFIIDIFAGITCKEARARLFVIGHGVELETARAYAERLGCADKIVFAGKVEHADVPSYLAAADIFILPYSDEFPHTLLNIGRASQKLYEYMAMGKPVVASDIGEVRESLKDGGGVLVPGNTADPFSDHIIALLASPNTMTALGSEARRRTENTYNYGSLGRKLAALYRKILET
ncbi:MAG: hypothetical protein A2487_17585 [Candidatus Raymondbacteria bacterium RifOxyC12_full_50_8]|uniref:Glycosyltransferase subfamily 4-like N-terminal domain-containing protein n=1 Tax=Candidatus Raymondbacteria bacterium RIFOXYD12_FULL_49_13 TaxID=1817890 RepID=A0A1F7FCX4_UNCRA|nr:MAG: hypothetical protein A2248_02930 [Candidatus Raymondbacteria bacterium RIFOXYA2_FULL_49_16]OGJ94221.1 MAG: hypothetical protein A2487_17585 [Candidatus Raymondbacteria bacterium RifOxyC12_full_50_8]OGK04306.1 MAG: hypothetical protein A2519_18280 [Candidatus Raymondbacteria bacterium RIFOXYD12_FULL_49_13]OGP42411.1 MAG: hypothetical protein A2324_16965 [Candidatus Raymondbacteria bacterium RIFOXYB2_FULL_49_35]